MRLWTIHPAYLDARGLVALWREGLLALKVLQGKTSGYRRHPQLERFRKTPDPVAYLSEYLRHVLVEAEHKGYCFDRRKLPALHKPSRKITETRGQLGYEWQHLLAKLKRRSPDLYRKLRRIRRPAPHPLFRIVPGKIRAWERPASK
jgi:hypothetical protein